MGNSSNSGARTKSLEACNIFCLHQITTRWSANPERIIKSVNNVSLQHTDMARSLKEELIGHAPVYLNVGHGLYTMRNLS